MQYSDIPSQFTITWASGATSTYVRPIPTPSQTGGNASLTDGFPPPTFVQVSAGGDPPDGRDMNGILQQLSAWARWLGAGAPQRFDGTMSSAIGGYPKGAILVGNTSGVYVSLQDNNTQDFNSSATQWQNLLATMTGDSGSGGKVGLVPAPPAGATASGFMLQANATWGQVATVNIAAGAVTSAKVSSTTGSGAFVLAASPALTGNPTAPTQTTTDNDTSIATTAFAHAAIAADLLLSPALGGTPTAPTPSTGDDSTKIATTAFVNNEIAANVYSGSSDTNVDFPVMTTLFIGNTLTVRNSTNVIRLQTGNNGYVIGGATTALSGTWAARGSGAPGGSNVGLAQRIA